MSVFDVITRGEAYIIAEMSANHTGKLEHALEIVRMAKKAGANCVKIQTYTADTMTIPSEAEYFRIRGGLWDGKTLYELYKEAATPWEWHRAIKDACQNEGLDFLSTPFDKTSVDFLEELGVEAYKIASFELVDLPLLQYVASKGKPMILSCGMATQEEIQEALETVYASGNSQVVLLKCSSEYPANPSNLNLATIADMKKRFQVPVGFSDHTLGSESAVVAVSLGACVVEKHFCLSRKLKGPDSAFSMEPHEFAELVKKVHQTQKIVGNILYGPSEKEKTSFVFRRSVFAVKDIQKGERFTEENIRVIRPGYGVKPKYYPAILGLPAREKLERGSPIQLDSIKPGCILFLSNNRNTRNVYHWLREQEEILLFEDQLTLELVKRLRPSFIISFNYRFLISQDVIQWMQGRMINLHLSLLPWNQGASPNFFSFYDDTPKGVTIHLLDQGIDTGDILCQREILLDETKESFASSYQFLMEQMEELFFEHWEEIKNGRLMPRKQSETGSYHTTAELKRIQQGYPFCWQDNISEFKQKYQIGR